MVYDLVIEKENCVLPKVQQPWNFKMPSFPRTKSNTECNIVLILNNVRQNRSMFYIQYMARIIQTIYIQTWRSLDKTIGKKVITFLSHRLSFDSSLSEILEGPAYHRLWYSLLKYAPLAEFLVGPVSALVMLHLQLLQRNTTETHALDVERILQTDVVFKMCFK